MTLPSEYQTKFWLALLNEIQSSGGRAKPSEIYPRMRRYFPEITDEDVVRRNPGGGNTWTNRIQFVRQRLVETGLLDKRVRGVWAITPIGLKWLKDNWRGADADYSAIEKPPKLEGKQPKPPKAAAASERIRKPEKAERVDEETYPLVQVIDPIETLCNRLVKAQRQSENYEEFELALRDAFEFLGFEAKHIGGPSETDVLLVTHLGQDSYRAVLDAKSTRSGRVSDAQINWPVLDTHRKQRGADYAVVVGEDFSGGNLQRFAEEYRVTLIRTQTICEVLRLHSITPFGLIELRELFLEHSLSTRGLESLRRRHEECQRHWRLPLEIVEHVQAYNRHVPAGLLPKADSLHYIMMGKVINGALTPAEAPSLQDIQEALAFLSSSAVGILRRIPGSDDTYQLVMTPDTARRRLAALASAANSPGRGGSVASTLSEKQPQRG